MSKTLAAILGGAAGAVALVGLLVIAVWYCIFRGRNASRTSEDGSSDPSQVGRAGGIEFTLRDARIFAMDELLSATKSFSDKSLIGQGKFGEVYKGLLHDGMIVAIKKRSGPPSQEFVDEVRYLSSIQHRNLVTLLGYCQENDQQILVYEYIPNGSVSVHLYGAGQVSQEKLEFKQRLTIALGVAKGLAYLHSLSPRLIHKDFKTANVLVDETLIPKVADAGVRNFLRRFEYAGTSSQVSADEIFLAPEYYACYLANNLRIHPMDINRILICLCRVREFRRFSDKSDVYSFGVFLLELVSGQEANELLSSDANQNLVDWVQNLQEAGSISTIIDQRLRNSYTTEGMDEFMRLLVHCVNPSSERRPPMTYVVTELDRILEKEMSLTTIMGEGTTDVTLGSKLFTASK